MTDLQVLLIAACSALALFGYVAFVERIAR
jgi:hypothetical protein